MQPDTDGCGRMWPRHVTRPQPDHDQVQTDASGSRPDADEAKPAPAGRRRSGIGRGGVPAGFGHEITRSAGLVALAVADWGHCRHPSRLREVPGRGEAGYRWLYSATDTRPLPVLMPHVMDFDVGRPRNPLHLGHICAIRPPHRRAMPRGRTGSRPPRRPTHARPGRRPATGKASGPRTAPNDSSGRRPAHPARSAHPTPANCPPPGQGRSAPDPLSASPARRTGSRAAG